LYKKVTVYFSQHNWSVCHILSFMPTVGSVTSCQRLNVRSMCVVSHRSAIYFYRLLLQPQHNVRPLVTNPQVPYQLYKSLYFTKEILCEW